jgi:uncharacterized membrane protein
MPGSCFFFTVSNGINASDQIVGTYSDATGQQHGFLLDQGNYTTLDVPGAPGAWANGINASGHIVGYYLYAYPVVSDLFPFTWGGSHGFLLDKGSYSTFDAPGVPNAAAMALSGSGQILGTYLDAVGQHGFLLDQGSYTTLDPPGSTNGRSSLLRKTLIGCFPVDVVNTR